MCERTTSQLVASPAHLSASNEPCTTLIDKAKADELRAAEVQRVQPCDEAIHYDDLWLHDAHAYHATAVTHRYSHNFFPCRTVTTRNRCLLVTFRSGA